MARALLTEIVFREDYLDPSPNFIIGINDSLIHNFPHFAYVYSGKS
jgi:hypothetical protein